MGRGGMSEAGSSHAHPAESRGVLFWKSKSLFPPWSARTCCLHLIGVVLVSVDEEAREEAVGPVRVIEKPVLL